MIKMVHFDDGKHKWESHEIYLKEEDFYNASIEVFSHNIFDIYGHGATKDEALEDFICKFKYIMNDLKAFEKNVN